MGFPGGSAVKNLPASVGDTGSIRGSERSPGAGNGNPLQYSCLENPMEEEPGVLQSLGWHRVGHDQERTQHEGRPLSHKAFTHLKPRLQQNLISPPAKPLR